MKNVSGELQETFGKSRWKEIHALCGGDEFMLTVMGTICEWWDRQDTVSGRSAIFCSSTVSPKELVNFSVVELYAEDGTGFHWQQGIFQLKS